MNQSIRCVSWCDQKDVLELLIEHIDKFEAVALDQFGFLCLGIGEYALALKVLSIAFRENGLDDQICLNLAEANYFSGNINRFHQLFKRAKFLNSAIAVHLDKKILSELKAN
ncbi:MAG: hypothetical protein IPP51_01810 [Bacteroidetes bacterium]|nr:hypothetical protein [Bacteroidota bacterium]